MLLLDLQSAVNPLTASGNQFLTVTATIPVSSLETAVLILIKPARVSLHMWTKFNDELSVSVVFVALEFGNIKIY